MRTNQLFYISLYLIHQVIIDKEAFVYTTTMYKLQYYSVHVFWHITK